MSLLQWGYLVDAIVTLPLAISLMSGKAVWGQQLLGEPMPGRASVRMMIGSLWTAILICVLLGVLFPRAMLAVLFLQLLYKSLWLIGFALPRCLHARGAEVSWRISGLFLAYVLVYPWLIPWKSLLSE